MLGLGRVDRPLKGQRPAPDVKPPLDSAHALALEIGCHLRQRIGIQRRITAARQDQIALDDPVLHRAGRDQPRAETIVSTKHVQRIKRRHRFRDARRGQPVMRAARLQHQPGFHIHHRKGDIAAQVRRLDQRLRARCDPRRLAARACLRAQRHRGRGGPGARTGQLRQCADGAQRASQEKSSRYRSAHRAKISRARPPRQSDSRISFGLAVSRMRPFALSPEPRR